MGAKYVQLDAIDFEERDWVPHSGWPFDQAALDPFYARAHVACGIGPFCYDAEYWHEKPKCLWLHGDGVLTCGVYQLGPARVFGSEAQSTVFPRPPT
jgi:hypothetical protein